MSASEIHAADIYAILQGWARRQLGPSAPSPSALDELLHEQAQQTARQLLTQTSVHLHLAHQGLDLRQVLQRGAVQAWQALHQPRPLFGQAPERCPSCTSLLLGKWQCDLCGLELFRWQALPASGTLDSQGFLPWRHALLPDPRRRRLILLSLDGQPEVVWQINLPVALCEQPVSVRLLPGQEILIADRSGKVLICDLFGELRWQCQLSLKEPVCAEASPDGQRILIADRGRHQVLMIGRDQQLLWAYGEPDRPGSEDGLLQHPHCLHATSDGSFLIADTGNRRVLEVSALSRKVRNLIGGRQHLEGPIWCERLPNGHTQILDASSYRLLDFAPEGELADSCVYYQEHLDTRYRLQDPLGIQRRENGQMVLSNAERVVEISPTQKRLLWFSLLTDLRPPAMFNRTGVTEERPSPLRMVAAPSVRSQAPFRLQEALRQVSVFEDAPAPFFEKIKLCLRYEEHPAGKILVREGQRGDAMYLIREGQVEIIKDFQTIATLGQGDVFGEMSLLNSEARTATVRAKNSCRLYKLNRLAFESVVQAFPEVHDRIRKLAEARQQLLQPAAEQPARERLEQLMATHRARLDEMRSRRQEPAHRQMVQGPLHWKLRYSALEQHLIQEARQQNYRCIELHIKLSSHCRMKSVRVSLLVMLLEKHGEIIKTHPSPEEILQEKVDQQVILSLLSRSSRARLIEEVTSVAEIDDVQAIPVQF